MNGRAQYRGKEILLAEHEQNRGCVLPHLVYMVVLVRVAPTCIDSKQQAEGRHVDAMIDVQPVALVKQ